ncbi:MAG: LAGLIDADG family homing endonuclease, partial [Nanoarchaeota archaeon]
MNSKIKLKNWGQIKGGRNSTGTTKKITIPQKDERLAELIGIILGDGSLFKFKGNKSTSYMLRIVGDSVKDREYLFGYVKPLVDSLFGIEAKSSKHRKWNELFITVNSKMVVEFLISMGMQTGDKIDNQVTIPDWIINSQQYLKACIRGLVDTDGSVYELKPHWPGLWQICFTNRNDSLINDFRNALIKIGINCSNIYRYKEEKKAPKVYITKSSEVTKFYKEIGFSNPKHRNKLQPRGVA